MYTRTHSHLCLDKVGFLIVTDMSFLCRYNYDVALDRPLEGRFEWAPVST